MATAPTDVKTSREKSKAYINSMFAMTKASFSNMSAENDIIHTDDTKISTIGGESSAYFQGIGAYADIIDVQMMNAVKTLGTLMNRRSSGSYALSSVEFKVITDMLVFRQRAEKRLVEDIARIWLRVHGYNATVKYTPNPIEWQKMLEKMEYQLKNQEFNRRNEEYGYISQEEAAQNTTGAETAHESRKGFFTYINKFLSGKSETETATEERIDNNNNNTENRGEEN